MKVLDLNVIVQDNQETFPIKCLDGKTYHIFKPSQKLTLKMANIAGNKANLLDVEKNAEGIINTLYEIVSEILSNNREGVNFSEAYLINSGYSIEICTAILNEYQSFITGVMSNPNYKSPQNRQQRRKKGKKQQ